MSETSNYERDLERENERLREHLGVSGRLTLEQSSELQTLRAKVGALGRDLLEAQDQAHRATQERDGEMEERIKQTESKRQMERERDEVREDVKKWQNLEAIAQSMLRQETAAREKAEADGAALRERLQAVCDAAMKSDWMGANGEREARFSWDEVEFALRLLHASDTGSALLERLRAAEAVVKAAPGRAGSDEDWRAFREAIAAYDAVVKP
jgi:type I site-specific restriction endonuclease